MGYYVQGSSFIFDRKDEDCQPGRRSLPPLRSKGYPGRAQSRAPPVGSSTSHPDHLGREGVHLI